MYIFTLISSFINIIMIIDFVLIILLKKLQNVSCNTRNIFEPKYFYKCLNTFVRLINMMGNLLFKYHS